MSGKHTQADYLSGDLGTRIAWGLGIACVLIAIADWLYTKHPHVSFEAWFNFYGFFAIVATVAVLLLCFALRPLLERKEDYYE